jgi:AcrR family transcriptional regulator
MKLADAGKAGAERRAQLTRQQVVTAAIELADRDGIDSISMRRLAQELGIEAMSLYTHVRNKDE